VAFMRMFGVGLTLAVIVDATVIRVVLLPAFMHLLGTWCWWAPKWLTRMHDRFGISEGHAAPEQSVGERKVSAAAMVPATFAIQEG
jgi:putative drug exporter of the RND superfamily